MGQVVAIDAWEIVRSKRFVDGAAKRVDGLAGYVRDFLETNAGKVNESGRPWTVELCADLLKIPGPTLRRWVADQGEPAPVVTRTPGRVRKSHAKAALSDPEQRRAVLRALPHDVRDDLRADLNAVTTRTPECKGCPEHCPSGRENR